MSWVQQKNQDHVQGEHFVLTCHKANVLTPSRFAQHTQISEDKQSCYSRLGVH